MTTNRTAKPYPTELRERAVRLVREHEAEHPSLAAALLGIEAANHGLDPIERADALEDALGDWSVAALSDLVEPAPDV